MVVVLLVLVLGGVVVVVLGGVSGCSGGCPGGVGRWPGRCPGVRGCPGGCGTPADGRSWWGLFPSSFGALRAIRRGGGCHPSLLGLASRACRVDRLRNEIAAARCVLEVTPAGAVDRS